MPNWVGDLVMATPVLVDLRQAFPQAQITAMCKAPLCELLQQETAIDELFCFTPPSNTFLRRQEHRNIIEKIRSGKYDTAILLTNSFSSAWWCWEGKIARRIGYRGNFRKWLLTEALPWSNDAMHQVDFYKKLLEPFEISRSHTAPRLILSPKETQEAKERLYQSGYRPGQKLIGINPGCAYGSAKCWPFDRFRALALELQKQAFVVFLGDAAGSDLVKKIVQGLPEKVLNFAGATRLREAAAVIQNCDLFITNDSGPMHIASALGIPLIALFGSTDDKKTGPYEDSSSVIHKKAACSPCFKKVCPIDFRCMKEISVEEVLRKARQSL